MTAAEARSMGSAPLEGTGAPVLQRRDLSQLFFRSFLFQSLWSHQRMQNVGWLFSLWPVFRRLHADPAERARAAQAHSEYFNTHPYTADIILGVVARMEEKIARDPSSPRHAILAAKKAMSGPLSALGETVFWATLRPLLLLAAATVGVLFPRAGWLVTPLVFLFTFNVLHVGVKAGGLWVGYRRGLDVAAFLVQWPMQVWAARASWLGLGLGAGALAVTAARADLPWAAAGLAAIIILLLRRGASPYVLPPLVVGAGFVRELIR